MSVPKGAMPKRLIRRHFTGKPRGLWRFVPRKLIPRHKLHVTLHKPASPTFHDILNAAGFKHVDDPTRSQSCPTQFNFGDRNRPS